VETIRGSLQFEPGGLPGRLLNGLPGPGIFHIVRKSSLVYLTYLAMRGQRLGDKNTFFRADDGRTWPVVWTEHAEDQTWFMLPALFPAGTV
jgi:hypothetical protein